MDHQLPSLQDVPRSAQQYVAEFFPVLEAARELANLNLQEHKTTMINKTGAQATRNAVFHVGDIVYMYTPVLQQGHTKKLSRSWHGPYYVIEKLSDIHVRLRHIHDQSEPPQKVHVNRLKHGLYRNPNSRADAHTADGVSIKTRNNETSETQICDSMHSDNRTQNGAKLQSEAPALTSERTHSLEVKDTGNVQTDVSAKTHSDHVDHTTCEDNYYEVEKILYKKPSQDQWKYRVKWLSFPASSNSWVSYDDLTPALQRLVTDTHDTIPTYRYKKYRKK